MMNIVLGIGTDIIEIQRIRRILETYKDRFLSRIFVEKEIEYCLKFKDPAPHFAARFCAKEAISKAFGLGIGKELTWHDFEIFHDQKGKPSVRFSLKVAKMFNDPSLFLSLSHCQEYAIAFAVRQASTAI